MRSLPSSLPSLQELDWDYSQAWIKGRFEVDFWALGAIATVSAPVPNSMNWRGNIAGLD